VHKRTCGHQPLRQHSTVEPKLDSASTSIFSAFLLVPKSFVQVERRIPDSCVQTKCESKRWEEKSVVAMVAKNVCASLKLDFLQLMTNPCVKPPIIPMKAFTTLFLTH
jgi:hypothetical protein